MKQNAFFHAGLCLAISEVGEGTPIVFQHGLCGDASQTAEVFPAGQGWRCLTMECRGHGRSDAGDPTEFSIATFANDLESFIEERALGPVALGGISMGAMIALRVAVERKDLVRALVLARPAWLYSAAPDNMAPNGLVGALLRHFPPDEARRRFDLSPTAADLAQKAPDNLASLRGFFTRQPIEITRELLCRISADGPGVTPEDVGQISVPTLVIGIGLDAIHPMLFATALANSIPRSRLAQITAKAESRQRHCADFRAALSTFLREIEL